MEVEERLKPWPQNFLISIELASEGRVKKELPLTSSTQAEKHDHGELLSF